MSILAGNLIGAPVVTNYSIRNAETAIRVDDGQPTPLLSAGMKFSELRDEEALFASIRSRRQYDRLVLEGFTRISQASCRQRILYQ